MNALNIMLEAAGLAGYTISAATGQDPLNKARAQRRLNFIKADIISRYGGKWAANYREGWLALGALYTTGTINVTINSNSVVGVGTVWTTSMKGQKLIVGNETYKIASVQSATALTLSQPYQQATTTGLSYSIWQDEYRLYPEAWAIGGFIDYQLPQRMTESWPTNMKDSNPQPNTVEEPTIYTVLNREGLTSMVSTGTVSVSQNSNVWTGSSTLWLSGSTPIEPGFEFTVGSYTYHVKRVNSDTELETYQQAVVAVIAGTTYTAKGKNSIVVRFRKPSTQRIVHYWYYAKDYPLVNDNDEDWVVELFPRVVVNGIAYFDYIDKQDVARATTSNNIYEDSIKNMKVAVEANYTGIRTLGIYIPSEARD